jgi:hypothetical protein
MQTLPLRLQTWLSRKIDPRARATPLRSELFSIEQLSRHAKELAEYHQVVTRPGPNRLLARLGQNEDTLRAARSRTDSIVRSALRQIPLVDDRQEHFVEMKARSS